MSNLRLVHWYYQFQIFGEHKMLEKDSPMEGGGFPLEYGINLVGPIQKMDGKVKVIGSRGIVLMPPTCCVRYRANEVNASSPGAQHTAWRGAE